MLSNIAKGLRELEITKILSMAPEKLRRVLNKCQRIMGGVMDEYGRYGDVMLQSGGEYLNVMWKRSKVTSRKVDFDEYAGYMKAYAEIEKKDVGPMVLLIDEQMPLPQKEWVEKKYKPKLFA